MSPERGRGPGSATRDALIVFAAALVPRMLHLQQISAGDPYFERPSVDGRLYHEWALSLLSGGGLGEQALSLAPLYALFLALVYSVAGPSFFAAKAVQLALGALSSVGVWALARRFFDARAALVAGLAMALYGMQIFYEGTHLIASIQAPVWIGLVLACVLALERPAWGRWFCAGLALGLCLLARPTALVFGIGIALSPWIARLQLPSSRRAALVGTFALGALLPLVPVWAHSLALGESSPFASSAGMNLYLGANPRASGTFRVPPDFRGSSFADPMQQRDESQRVAQQRLGRELTRAEVSGYWRGEALEWVAAHPVDWLRLELRKAALFANALELWNNRSYTIARGFSRVLDAPLLGFGVLAPLAALGLVSSAGRWRALWPLHLAIATQLTSALVFFVLARYRMPIVPFLAVFVGAGAVALLDALRARAWVRAAPLLATLAAAAVIVHWPVDERENLHMAHFNLANRYRELGRWEIAAQHYWSSLEWSDRYLPAYSNLALTYEQSGTHRREAILTWTHLLMIAERDGFPGYAARARRHLEALGAGEPAVPDPQR